LFANNQQTEMLNSLKSTIETERLSIENIHDKKTLDGNEGHALVIEISSVTEKFLRRSNHVAIAIIK